MSRPAASGGVPLDRVVVVLATLADGTEQLGSGYVVSPGVVVTAKHCTRDKRTKEPARIVRVVNAATRQVRDSLRVWTFPGLDVAALTSEIGETFHSNDVSTTYGRVDRTQSGALRDCVGIGFPRFQLDPTALTRGHAELHGVIHQTDESESGNLLFREPLLETVRADVTADGSNAWSGFSGAVVFRAGLALGVVVEHHRRQSSSSTQLVAFDELARRSVRSERHRGFCELLGIPDLADLAVASPEAGPGTSPLTAGEILPFEFLDAHCSIFGLTARSLRPTYAEYTEGRVHVGRHGPELESLLADGSVLLVGRGAAGKTTVCAWIGVQHSLRAGDAYYLDLALLDDADVLSIQARLVDLVAKLATAQSILIVENAHRAPALASTLYRQWVRIGAPGRLLMTERLVRNARHRDEPSPIAELVDVAHELVITAEDLVLTLERNTAASVEVGPLRIQPATSARWLALFAGDRMAFTLAVRRHLETEGLEAWVSGGAVLTADDSVAHVLDEYVFRWPQARADLVRLAVGASLEVAIDEDALNLGALETPLRDGFVHRTVNERTANRYYALAHSGLGALVLSACRVESKAAKLLVILDIVRRSPATGYRLAGRLEAGGDVDEAVATLRACVQTPPGLALGMQPPSAPSSLRQFARHGIISLEEIDQVLTEPVNAPLSTAMIHRYPKMVALGHLRLLQHRLPKLVALLGAELGPVLATPTAISELSEHLLTTSLGEWMRLLSLLPSLLPNAGLAISGAIARQLASPEHIDALADASLRDLGDGIDFLDRFPTVLPGAGDEVVRAVIERWATPESTVRVARSCLNHLSYAARFLDRMSQSDVEFGQTVVNAVVAHWSTPSGIELLFEACIKHIGDTIDFFTRLSARYPDVGNTIVQAVIERWSTPDGLERLAGACLKHIGHTVNFFDGMSRLMPEVGARLADSVSALWNTPDGIDQLADACLSHLGFAIDFLERAPALFADLGQVLVDAVLSEWNTPERLDRVVSASLKHLGYAVDFVQRVPTLSPEHGPALSRALLDGWSTQEGVVSLAELCVRHLGYAVDFFERAPALFGEQGSALAEAIVDRWHDEVEIGRLAEGCLSHLGYASMVLDRLPRLFPDRGPDLVAAVVARWGTPTGFARLMFALDRAIDRVAFITHASRHWPRPGPSLLERMREDDSLDVLAGPFAAVAPLTGLATLSDFARLDRGLLHGVLRRIVALHGPDPVAGLAAATIPRSAWLLRECESALPDVVASVFPLLATTPTVESYFRTERAGARVADAFDALAIVARGALPFTEPWAMDLHRLLLDVFRQGWHLDAKVRLVDLVRVIPAEEAACLAMATELSAALGAAARSKAWLRREFAVTARGPIIDAVSDLWWSAAELADVRSLSDDLLARRIQDDIAVLDLAKPAPEIGSDAIRLLGLAWLYGIEVTVPVGLIGERTFELALEVSESHRLRRQLLLGALWLHESGYGKPAGVGRFLDEVRAIVPCGRRADQAVVRDLLVAFVES